MEQNLTTGSVFRNVVRFSLPYLLAYFLQTLYGMADLFIVGQYEGVAATTAVSIGSQVMHMLTVMLVGLAMGTTVSIARAVGAGNRAEAAKATGNTVTLFAVVSLALTAVLLLLVRPITAVMSTPAEAVDGTAAYLTICFCGIPFITAYNILSSIFRGMGDSKSPLYFVAVACAANIALDYFFMGALHMGPAGAALGTTLSQALSVLIALLAIRKRRMISLQKSDLRPQKAVMGQILRIGLPVLAQDGLVQIGFLIITIIANQRGLTDAAAVGIVEKFISFGPRCCLPSRPSPRRISARTSRSAPGRPSGIPLPWPSASASWWPSRSSSARRVSSACSRPTRRRSLPARTICAAISSTACSPVYTSASAAISARAANRACRSCTASLPLCSSVSRARI